MKVEGKTRPIDFLKIGQRLPALRLGAIPVFNAM